MTVPVVGQVTDSVAMSPTLLAKGWYWVTVQTAVNAGFVDVVVVLTGFTTTVALLPNNGHRVASISPAPKP